MTRSKHLKAILLAGVAMLAFIGCHTTVVQPVERVDPQHHDDHHDDRDQPPPPPDHHDDRR